MMSMVFKGAKCLAASLKADTSFGPINRKKVARIMKAMGLKGFTTRRRCVTARRRPGHRVMSDLVDRKFTDNEPSRVYFGDITYLPCRGGKTCIWPQSLTCIRANLQVVHSQTTCECHWSSMLYPTHMVCVTALMNCIPFRARKCVHLIAFRNYSSSLGVGQSMGAVGTSADNALAESFNATL